MSKLAAHRHDTDGWRFAATRAKDPVVGPEWIVLGIVMGLLAGGVGAAAVGAASRGNAYQDQVEAIWRSVAESIGGRLDVLPPRPLEPRSMTISAEVDDVPVTAQVRVPVAPGNVSHTRAEARYVLGVGPEFHARPRRVNEPGQDRLPRSILADDPAAAAAALGAQARGLVDTTPRPLTLRARDGAIEVIWDGAEADAAVIENALRLTAAIARFGSDHLRGLSTLDDAEYEAKSDEGPRVRVRSGLVEVRFLVAKEERSARWQGVTQMAYIARVSARAGTPALASDIDDEGALHPPAPDGIIDPAATSELARVGPAHLRRRDAHLEIVWSEGPTLEQASAAVRILSAIGANSGSQGAFR